jgi:hypothetical protein
MHTETSYLGNVARQLDAAGADGLVLFNRFYQPDIDIKTMRPSHQLELSASSELLLRLRWLAILHGRVRPCLAVTGGVATPDDGIKALLAGADACRSYPPSCGMDQPRLARCAGASNGGWSGTRSPVSTRSAAASASSARRIRQPSNARITFVRYRAGAADGKLQRHVVSARRNAAIHRNGGAYATALETHISWGPDRGLARSARLRTASDVAASSRG